MSEKDIIELIGKAKDFINSSKLLYNAGDYDSSASRIYYAMFFTVQAALFTKKLKSKSHGNIIALFGEHFIKTNIFPKEMGRQINRAYEKRQIGDYGFKKRVEKDIAEELLTKGNEFVEKIIDYLKQNDYLK